MSAEKIILFVCVFIATSWTRIIAQDGRHAASASAQGRISVRTLDPFVLKVIEPPFSLHRDSLSRSAMVVVPYVLYRSGEDFPAENWGILPLLRSATGTAADWNYEMNVSVSVVGQIASVTGLSNNLLAYVQNGRSGGDEPKMTTARSSGILQDMYFSVIVMAPDVSEILVGVYEARFAITIMYN